MLKNHNVIEPPTNLNPNSERDRGARPPRAQFSAPSRKTPVADNCVEVVNSPQAENAGREGASSDARGGRAPLTSEFGLSSTRAPSPVSGEFRRCRGFRFSG